MINIIVDCNYLCYVNRFALSQGLSYRGERTEIIFGFVRHLLELATNFESNKFYFCWDSRESLRREIYPTYKANRRPDNRPEEEKEADQIAYNQFNELKNNCLKELGFKNVFERKGYESDDIIAILTNKLEQPNIVVSSDNDLYQLLDRCSMYNISKKQLTTKQEFVRKYGIEPSEWINVKKLSGCSSDNVKGVVGIGEKTALKFVKNELKSKTTLFTISNSKDIIEMNLKLIKLPLDNFELPIYKKDELTQEKFKFVFNNYGLFSFINEKQWNKFIKHFMLRSSNGFKENRILRRTHETML